MLQHPEYKIAFVLDQKSMFRYSSGHIYTLTISSIMGERKGKVKKHQVKPLKLIWEKMSFFGPHNTIHVDDLSRNFAMNPKEGLKIGTLSNLHP